MLTREFPHVPSIYIRRILAEKRKLHPTYLFLANQENSEEKSAKPYERLKRARRSSANGPDAAHVNGQLSVAEALQQELNSAKAKAGKEAGKYASVVRGSHTNLMKKMHARKRNTRKPSDSTRRSTLAQAPSSSVSAATSTIPRIGPCLARKMKRTFSATRASVRRRRRRLGT